jgi:signal transduction histidine kinase
VVFDATSGQPVLIDFSRATTVAEHQPGFFHHNAIDGSLATLAPEQTGRTGRPVDLRADLYSFGAMLYQMATGVPPFIDADPLSLLRDILARVPVPPAVRDPDVPVAFSMIIMRLLEKEPDQRYQSAEGLAHDLRRLSEGLTEGVNSPFPLGEHDFPLRLSAPGRLVGRQTELSALERALDGALRDECRAVLVSGAPGVGKTVLINELRPMVTARGGWFVYGKFDQHRRDQAADAVSQALRFLGRLLLTESDADLQRHRSRMLGTLGGNAGLIASWQPELALVLGVAEEAFKEGASHLRERLVRATLDVLRGVASAPHPVVLFLDDLQWAEAAQIDVFDTLLHEDHLPGLLVVGAFREQEVDESHPLASRLERWSRLPKPPVALRPGNLAVSDLGVMLAEMLRLPAPSALALAELIGERSGGNPFDTVALVNALRKEGALVRDASGWRWDPQTMRRHVGEGDVVDLLAARIERLPEPTADLVRRVACLGGEVETELLCVAIAVGPSELDETLTPALEDGLLLTSQADRALRTVVRFRHDRVQQAALSGLSPRAFLEMRVQLARRLAAHPQFAMLAADQYLPATGIVTDPTERRAVVRLFHDAAQRLRLVNPTMTERLLAAALTVLDSGSVAGREDGGDAVEEASADQRIRLALEICHHAALYHLGWLSEADERYRSVERMSPEALDLAVPTCDQISGLTFRQRSVEAVELGLDLLRRLGVPVPTDEQIGPWSDRDYPRFHRWAREGELAEDLARPEATDLVGMAAARLINRMIPPAYFAGMPIMPWLVFECQRLWVEHGPCSALVGPLSHSGFVSIMIGQHYRAGYTAVRRVVAVSDHFGHEPETSQAWLLLALSVAGWFEPLEIVVGYAKKAFQGLVQSGDRQNASFTAYALVPSLLECTPTLEEYLAEVDTTLALAEQAGNTQTKDALIGYRQLARALLGRTDGPGELSDRSFDSVAHLVEQKHNAVASAYAHVSFGIAALLSGDTLALAEHSAGAIEQLLVYQATMSAAIAHVLRALALAETLRAGAAGVSAPDDAGNLWVASDDRVVAMAELGRYRDWLGRRAADAPDNFEHLLYLVDAERAWACGDFRMAAAAFDAALFAVATRQRPWHAALTAERAAWFHLTNGLEHTGRFLLAEARDRYQAWGAAGKVLALEEAHPFLRSGSGRHRAAATAASQVSSETIDLLAVLRACQVLSSETSLARLYTRVREVLSALTGATSIRVAVWRDERTGWYVPSPEGSGGPGTPVDESAPADLVPLSAFRYAERTRVPLLVPDVTVDDRFSADPFFRLRLCRSLLVVPILSHGKPRAMVILEHRLSKGAFTADRLDAVRLLVGQLAVSLENAIIYEELEERVHQRTRELRATQSELIATARRAGMAEIATNVLHNVGNVLTSVNVSANLIANRTRSSKVEGLSLAVNLLCEHEADLGTFLATDERGRLLPGYLSRVAEALTAEHHDIAAELAHLSKNIDHIKDIVATQQTYAGAARVTELTDVVVLIEDALRVNSEALERHQVTVVRRFTHFPTILLDRARILLILVNLISNAKNAMALVTDRARLLRVEAEIRGAADDLTLRIGVADTGTGIHQDHLTQIFGHGFTTRADGHGFGLHSCALAAGEMDGTLSAYSEGPGRGAYFVLEVPVTIEEAE